MSINDLLQLPCGVTLKNRLAKSAMSENLAVKNLPAEKLFRLYETWGAGELGLIVTGNIMVDGNELGEPNNVVLEDDAHLDAFRTWTSGAKKHGSQIWAQINHPGRQAPAAISRATVAPSAIQLKMGSLAFRTPRELTDAEIHALVAKYTHTAALCKEAGFDGVQIHGAHGYLVSQFLSPLANRRSDRWGGSIENRMRFVQEIVRAMRARVGKNFPIGIKINSADFQRGGFAEDDAVEVVKMLEHEGVDLIEISGGTYEAAAMTGRQEVLRSAADTKSSVPTTGAQDVLGFAAGRTPSSPTTGISTPFDGAQGKSLDDRTSTAAQDVPESIRDTMSLRASTAAREAYFLPFAEKIRQSIKIPLMLTGGFRSARAMNAAVASGAIDVVGLARPLAMEPHLARRLLSAENAQATLKPVKTGIAAIDRLGVLEIGYFSLQLDRLGEGKDADPNLSPLLAIPLLGLNYSSGIISRLFRS